MSTQSYRAGVFIAQHKKLSIAAACACAIAYLGWHPSAAKQDNPPVTQPAKANQADLCKAGEGARIDQAKAHLDKKQYDAAAALIYTCTGHIGPAETALLGKAIDAAAAQKATQVQAEQARAKAMKKTQGVTIGMSQQDVLDSSWGKPQRVNRSTNKYGVREQWVYGPGNYLYFENATLTSIQN